MTWLAIKLALGGFFKRIPWQVWAALAALAAVWMAFHFVGNHIDNIRTEARRAGIDEANTAFANAQAAADKFERARIAKLAITQDAVSKGASHALDQTNDDITRRADAIRVRHDAARAGSAPSGLNLSAAPAAPGQPGQAQCDGLPFEAALDALTEAQRLGAQLNQALDFYDAQAALIAKHNAEAQ